MAVVIGLVIRSIGIVELPKPGDAVLDRRVCGKIKYEWLDLGPQEMIWAASAKLS